jgi:hypothetical protein
VLLLPAQTGVASAENGERCGEGSPANIIPVSGAGQARPDIPIGMLVGVGSGQMLAGVSQPGPEDVGDGSRLLGHRVRLVGANGHVDVRHAVDATLLGVQSGFDGGVATGKAPQEEGAGSEAFDVRAPIGSINFGC